MLTPSIVVFLIKAPTKSTIQNPIAAMVKIVKSAKPAPEFQSGLIFVNTMSANVSMKRKIEIDIQAV